jgi:hypothetical protein
MSSKSKSRSEIKCLSCGFRFPCHSSGCKYQTDYTKDYTIQEIYGLKDEEVTFEVDMKVICPICDNVHSVKRNIGQVQCGCGAWLNIRDDGVLRDKRLGE